MPLTALESEGILIPKQAKSSKVYSSGWRKKILHLMHFAISENREPKIDALLRHQRLDEHR